MRIFRAIMCAETSLWKELKEHHAGTGWLQTRIQGKLSATCPSCFLNFQLCKRAELKMGKGGLPDKI